MDRHQRSTATLAFLALALVVQAPAAAMQKEPQDPLEMGRQLTQWFYEGELDQIWGRFSSEMREALVSIESFGAFQAQAIDAQLGSEIQVLNERVQPVEGYQVYLRTARFSNFDGPILVQWAFDSSGNVAGFFIRPKPTLAPSEYLDYRTKTALRLPFDGEWYVFWGGRALEENYHVTARDQRFAYDLLIRPDGNSHTGDGTLNEQYHCFGEPLLAPAAGQVAAAVDGVSENRPGVMNPKEPLGNHVILDHGNGEFSFMAHLRQGSVAVKSGDHVEAGELLGQCGNTGNSSEPHLHYHLQTNALFGQGDALPAQFLNYAADGKPIARGEPVKGQTIRNQGPSR